MSRYGTALLALLVAAVFLSVVIGMACLSMLFIANYIDGAVMWIYDLFIGE